MDIKKTDIWLLIVEKKKKIIDIKKNDILVLGKCPTQRLEQAMTKKKKMFSINLPKITKACYEPALWLSK